ncbi:hypothetical protein TSUD_90560 [Trifolium subterraneum]|uniref:Uncharacterized protein n=1 Tax=Trifolium subterraneum TaxID=3900 RepID=A0A2Z6P0P5_TRISU|nr:hypothetical protein TSUD_90560 [Trifolium subterraneum]
MRLDYNFIFSVPNLVRSSCFATVTLAPVFSVPSAKDTVNTTSATSPQHLVPLFDPGGYVNVQEFWSTNQALLPPPKAPDRSFYSVVAFLYNNEFAKETLDYSAIWTLFSGFVSTCHVQVLRQVPYLIQFDRHFNFYTFSIASNIYKYFHKLCLESHVDALACYRNEWKSEAYGDSQCLLYLINFYANVGVYYAQKVFAEMPKQSNVTWLTFIQGFIDFGKSASHTYQWFVERPLLTSYNFLLFQDTKTLVKMLVANLQTSLQTFSLTLASVLFACHTFESLLFGTQGMASKVQNYSAILVKCKKLSYGSAFKFSDVSLGLALLVHNGHSNLLSFLVVNPFEYIAKPYSYMRALDCYGVVLLAMLIGKTSMKRIKSITIGCCKPIMQYQQGLLMAIMGGVFLTLELGILYYFPNNPIVEHVTKNLVFGLGVLRAMLNVVVIEIAYEVLHVSIKGGKTTFFQDAHIPFDWHESFSSMIQTHNSQNSIIDDLLFHPTLVCGNRLTALDMPSLWLPRSCSDYANSPWNKIVQSIRASSMAEVDSYFHLP